MHEIFNSTLQQLTHNCTPEEYHARIQETAQYLGLEKKDPVIRDNFQNEECRANRSLVKIAYRQHKDSGYSASTREDLTWAKARLSLSFKQAKAKQEQALVHRIISANNPKEFWFAIRRLHCSFTPHNRTLPVPL